MLCGAQSTRKYTFEKLISDVSFLKSPSYLKLCEVSTTKLHYFQENKKKETKKMHCTLSTDKMYISCVTQIDKSQRVIQNHKDLKKIVHSTLTVKKITIKRTSNGLLL